MPARVHACESSIARASAPSTSCCASVGSPPDHDAGCRATRRCRPPSAWHAGTAVPTVTVLLGASR
eukprot:5456805-Prymnesium_polylepis.1